MTCSPASGSLFPLGATTVTCTATDAAGNSGQTSVTVTLVEPEPLAPVEHAFTHFRLRIHPRRVYLGAAVDATDHRVVEARHAEHRRDLALAHRRLHVGPRQRARKDDTDAVGKRGEQADDGEVRLEAATVDRLFEAVESEPGYRLTVDLAQQQVVTPGGEAFAFEIDAFRRHCLMEGLDDIGLTLQNADDIRAYEQRRQQEAPWLFGM